MPTELSDRATAGRQVAASYLQPLLETAAGAGVPTPALARAAGLDAAALAPDAGPLTAQAYLHLLETGARLTGDAHFGLHVGERVRPGTYSVYGMVLLSCRDFGQALEHTQRYERLAHDLGVSRIGVDGAVATYRWDSHFPDATRHLAESVFAGIQVFGNWLAGGRLPPAPLRFAHARPDDACLAEYERIFGVTPSFGADCHAATFAAALLAHPVANADTSLHPVLQNHAEQLLQERLRQDGDGADLVARARAAIAAALPANGARLANVAAALDVSPRALQRRLAGAGTTFQGLLDAVRRDLALDYLPQAHLSLSDIAFLLGYQEQSAFNHAFRLWTGTNPGAYRQTRRPA
jgi:AraC-like DNA-binding protein